MGGNKKSFVPRVVILLATATAAAAAAAAAASSSSSSNTAFASANTDKNQRRRQHSDGGGKRKKEMKKNNNRKLEQSKTGKVATTVQNIGGEGGWWQPPPPPLPPALPHEPDEWHAVGKSGKSSGGVHHGQNGGHTGPHYKGKATTTSVQPIGSKGSKSKSAKAQFGWNDGSSSLGWWGGGGKVSNDEEETIPIIDDGLPTIVDIALDNPNFSTLVAAVTAAGLVDTLSGDGPFTVFAPTNEAFAALPEETLDSLLQPENVDALTDILTYHVVTASAPSSSLSSGDVIETFNGETVVVSISEEDGSVMVNDANVINPDIMGSNGIIHVIDKVLIPASPPSDGDNGGDEQPVVRAGELLAVEDDESDSSKSNTEWWGGGSGWWVADGSKSSKTSSSYNKSGKVIAASTTGWTNPHSIPTSGWKPPPPYSKPHNPHAHHGPHPQAKSVKSVKSAKHVKSAKGSFGWNGAWEGGSGDTNDWWAPPPSGDSEIMGDDYWWGGAVTPCPPGKAGKDCDTDKIPTMEPTPCGKAGKECEDHLPDLGDVPVTFVTPAPVGYMDGTAEAPVTAPLPGEEEEPTTATGAPTPMEVAATPPGRTGGGGGGTTIGDLIPVTVAPISSPPSSGWPTWTPTSTPTSTLNSLEASGTWFQSGRAYEVDASHYRADLKKNGLLIREENGIAFEGDEVVASSSSSSGMRGLDRSLSNLVILGGITVMSFMIMMIQ